MVRTETRLARTLAFLQHLEERATTVASASVPERVRTESKVRNNVQRLREIVSGLAGDLAMLNACCAPKKTDEKQQGGNLQRKPAQHRQRPPHAPQNEVIMRSRLCSDV